MRAVVCLLVFAAHHFATVYSCLGLLLANLKSAVLKPSSTIILVYKICIPLFVIGNQLIVNFWIVAGDLSDGL